MKHIASSMYSAKTLLIEKSQKCKNVITTANILWSCILDRSI